jgi:hypothetical protein
VELKKLGIFATGIVRANRLSGIVMKNANTLEKEGRGAMDYRISEVDGVELCCTRWFDNNIVNCLSTLHGCEPTDLVKRWSASEKKHIQVVRPNVIKTYNEYMGGVDLMDMLISLYRINVQSKKYYLKIIFHLIDLSIVNGWLLYRKYCSHHRLPKNEILSLLKFRTKIAEALLKPVVLQRPTQRGRPAASFRKKQKNSTNNTLAISARLPADDIRLDRFQHWPNSTTKGRCRNYGCKVIFIWSRFVDKLVPVFC